MINLLGDDMENNLRLRIDMLARDKNNLYRTIERQNKIIAKLEKNITNHDMIFIIIILLSIMAYGILLLNFRL